MLISPWNPKAKLWLQGRENLLQKIKSSWQSSPTADVIWMHCASLGEFEQGRPVLEYMRSAHPNARLVLTFFSASGYEIRKTYEGADHIFYLPMDSLRNASDFISVIRPTLVLWVKYEYWYYYLRELQKQHIPVFLLSAIFKKNQVFFKSYGGFYRKMIGCFTHIFVQDEASKNVLQSIFPAGNITVSGDTRFDRVIDIAGQFAPVHEIASFCGSDKVIVAGSTWQEDEEELDHFANTHPEIRFIIAPHEIDREHLADIQKLFHHSTLYSNWKKLAETGTNIDFYDSPNVLIIDNIGLLSRLYQYATVTYIGGGFGKDGVHNVLEAAVYGKPVVFGPVYEQFREAVELLDCGGAFSIENALELEKVFSVLLHSDDQITRAGDSAKQYVYQKRGATEKIISYLKRYEL